MAEDPSIPPQSPDVQAQQQEGSPLAAYAERSAQQGAMQQQPTGMQLAELRMNEISQKLTDVAKVLSLENPALMEYVKKMAQVGALFMQEIQASKQQQAQGPGPRAGLEPSRAGAEGSPTNALAA